MAKLFADLIRYKKQNEKTGKMWVIDDIPTRYYDKVYKILYGKKK